MFALLGILGAGLVGGLIHHFTGGSFWGGFLQWGGIAAMVLPGLGLLSKLPLVGGLLGGVGEAATGFLGRFALGRFILGSALKFFAPFSALSWGAKLLRVGRNIALVVGGLLLHGAGVQANLSHAIKDAVTKQNLSGSEKSLLTKELEKNGMAASDVATFFSATPDERKAILAGDQYALQQDVIKDAETQKNLNGLDKQALGAELSQAGANQALITQFFNLSPDQRKALIVQSGVSGSNQPGTMGSGTDVGNASGSGSGSGSSAPESSTTGAPPPAPSTGIAGALGSASGN